VTSGFRVIASARWGRAMGFKSFETIVWFAAAVAVVLAAYVYFNR
jgi:hypothetical protein